MTPAALIMIGLIVYTGFAIPVTQMRGWSRWINYIDPIGYGFESLMVNEFHGRQYSCSQFVPTGPGYDQRFAPENRICSVVGSQPGQNSVSGDVYLRVAYAYENGHRWRNFRNPPWASCFSFWVYIWSPRSSSRRSDPRGRSWYILEVASPLHCSKGSDDVEAQDTKSKDGLGGRVERTGTSTSRPRESSNVRRAYSHGGMWCMTSRSKSNLGGYWIM